MIQVTVRGKLFNPRDLAKEIRNSAEKAVRRAAGPLVDLKRTKDGFVASGSPDAIRKLKERFR